MNKIALATALAVLPLAIPTAASAQRVGNATIVVVDTDRIFRECTACVSAQAQLQAQIASAQQRAQALGQPLQTEAQSLQQAAQAAQNQTGAARTATETSLRQRAQALETRQTAANQELARLEQNIQSTRANVGRQLNERLNPIINQVMTARGANLAVDTGATLAHAQALDVTNEVLAALNQQLPSVSVVPLPQAPATTQPQPTGR
jgi:outer membrane protein